MTDIVIPLTKETRHNDLELKFTLRGIEKYLTGYRNIYIVGKKREWLIEKEVMKFPNSVLEKEGVIYIDIDLQENTSIKQWCIFQKMLKAAKDERVSDKFAMWHDDHFLVQPLDIKEIKYWKSGNLLNLGATCHGTYRDTVLRTNKYCQENGWKNDHFDVHVPILFEKSRLISLENEDWKRDMVLKSLYCNKFGIKGEDFRDLKVGRHRKGRSFTKEEIHNMLTGRTLFSIGEDGFSEPLREVLGELYPEPSKYEVKVIEDMTLTHVSLLPDGSHGIGYIDKTQNI